MRRFPMLVVLILAFCAASVRQAFARPSAAELLQPVIAEIDKRLAALAQATTPAELKLKIKIEAARAAIAANAGNLDDARALSLLKKVSGKIEKTFPSDTAFNALLKTALDGFAAVITTLRSGLETRINGLADPVLAAKARKGLAKLDGLIAEAAAPGLVLKDRAKLLGSALVRAGLVNDSLSKCPGHPGEFGHGQVLALVDGNQFTPRFASGEMLRNSAGEPLNIHIDGYHFPYAKGTVGLTILATSGALTTATEYSFAANTLSGTYQKDNVSFNMESGRLTLSEFDPVARRIVGVYEFTGFDSISSTRVAVTSGSFTVCDFKVTIAAKR